MVLEMKKDPVQVQVEVQRLYQDWVHVQVQVQVQGLDQNLVQVQVQGLDQEWAQGHGSGLIPESLVQIQDSLVLVLLLQDVLIGVELLLVLDYLAQGLAELALVQDSPVLVLVQQVSGSQYSRPSFCR